MSKSKNKNPYQRGNYVALFAKVQKDQIVTKAGLITYAVEKLGMTETAADASVTVVLSPRERSERGDCRGNISAQGHLYYMDKLKRKKGEDQKLRLRWRPEALPVRVRGSKSESVEATSTKATSTKAADKASDKAADKAKTEAKTETKTEAETEA